MVYHRFDFAAAGFGFADDDVDVMLFKSLQAVAKLRRPEIHQLAVDTRPPIAETARAGDNFFAAVGAGDAIENLASRQRANLPSALDAVLFSDFGIKQTQIVIDLRDGRYG